MDLQFIEWGKFIYFFPPISDRSYNSASSCYWTHTRASWLSPGRLIFIAFLAISFA